MKSTRSTRATRRNTVDPFGIDVALRERLKPFLRLLYNYYWRVEVEGIENIPDGAARSSWPPITLARSRSTRP